MEKVKKIKVVYCKDCKDIKFAGCFPLCEKDDGAIKQFKEFAEEGYEIDVIDNPDKINWCKCENK